MNSMNSIALSLLAAVAVALPTNRLKLHEVDATSSHFEMVENAFTKWKMKHNRTYTGEEHEQRRLIFAEHMTLVTKHNSEGHSWSMGMTKFADMTHEEFSSKQMLQMSTIGTEHSSAPDRHVNSGSAPTTIDWRNSSPSLVGPVKNQEQCGSCWAFSTVVSVEGQLAKKTGKYTSLSEQDLVDCVKDIEIDGQSCCSGCKGGLMDYGFTYLIKDQAGKDTTETVYPYTAADGTCSFQGKAEASLGIKSYTDIAKGAESDLKDACGTVGPISIAVNAAPIGQGWQLYHGGIYDPWLCDGDKLDHGVAVVGYGSENGKDYWIIRNSWGATWGENGYMRIAYGGNKCGLANSASYPTM